MRKKSIKKRYYKGFTLMELLVVIGLLSVLASAVIIIFNPIGQIQKSQDAKRKSDLSQVRKALELYYQDNGRYPASTGTYSITGANWGSAFGTYMVKLPTDPTTTKRYVYYSPGNNQSYFLYANLDRGATDPQACTGGNPCPNAAAANIGTQCGGNCNFGMTSPNTTP